MDRLSGSIRLIGGIDGGIRGSVPVNGKVERPETVYVRELRFANHYEFPSIGEEGCLYIAKDENATYRYDKQERAYICVGRDRTEEETLITDETIRNIWEELQQ